MLGRFLSNRRVRSLLLASLATVMGLAIAEAATWIFLDPPGLMPLPEGTPPGLVLPHPERGYEYSPNYEGELRRRGNRIHISTNSLGFRGDDLDPDDERPVILAMGDSFTVGFGVQAEEAWPAQLESILRSHRPDNPVRVVNGCVSGYSLSQIRLTMQELFDAVEPQLVVLGLYASRYWRLESPYVYHEGFIVNSDPLCPTPQYEALHSERVRKDRPGTAPRQEQPQPLS